jgi:hypothetical protein
MTGFETSNGLYANDANEHELSGVYLLPASTSLLDFWLDFPGRFQGLIWFDSPGFYRIHWPFRRLIKLDFNRHTNFEACPRFGHFSFLILHFAF